MQKFCASVAIHDGVSRRASPLTFSVHGDGASLWTSAPVQEHMLIQSTNLDVRNVDVLEIRVTCPGSFLGTYAVWIDAAVTPKRKIAH